MVITRWRSLKDARSGERAPLDLDVFRTTPEGNDKAARGGWSPATFRDDHRKKENVEQVDAIAFDYDGGTRLDAALAFWRSFAGFVHTTFSHTPEAHRFRVVLYVSRPISPTEHPRVWSALARRAKAAGHELDETCKDASRFWYLPVRAPGAEYSFAELAGSPVDVDQVVAGADDDRSRRYGAGALSSAVANIANAANGTRNHTLNREAFAIARLAAGGGVDGQLARDALHDAAARVGLEEAEIRKTLDSAFGAGAHTPRAVPPPRASVSRPGPPRARGVSAKLTDVANAERLVQLHGTSLRYVGTWSKGLAWDGKRWTLDDEGHWQRAAIATARVLVEEALDEMRDANASGDEDRVKRAKADLTRAIGSQNSGRLAAMMFVARADEALIVAHGRLDRDAWLLNVDNGTIDLRCGRLRAHRREDLLTKVAPVAFDSSAKCPTWEQSLLRWMGGDQELVDYLARLIGYALTGDVSEHVLAFFYGAGANGKSTFLRTIHELLGEYATPAPRGLLFRSRGERHPTELASLHGRRFVTCSEIEEGQAFDEALTKDLTGGDPIECRRMREDFWSFAPTHKLFLAGNHKPTVRGDDEGIWRRMRLVPWSVTIPEAERDPQLPARLREELPGVLAWAVRGCLAWQAKGLAAPATVHAATTEYREESDRLGEFFALHARFESSATVARKELRDRYEAFCTENGDEPVGAKRFAARLRERGVTPTSVRTEWGPRDGWRGVRVATDAERAVAVAWGTRRDVVPVVSSLPIRAPARAHNPENQEPDTTSHDVPTDEQEGFADYLEREGIGGGR